MKHKCYNCGKQLRGEIYEKVEDSFETEDSVHDYSIFLCLKCYQEVNGINTKTKKKEDGKQETKKDKKKTEA